MRKLGTKTYYKKQADNLMAKLIRARGKCEWCGRVNNVQLQCAHYVGRNNHNLRYDPMNLLCLCAGCHRKGHDDPDMFVKWFEKKFPRRAEHVRHNRNLIVKRNAQDYKDIVDMCKAMIKERGI